MEPPYEALLAIAQIALGLAGFGGVFVAMSQARSGERRPADTYRLVLLLSVSLSTLFLALVPVALDPLGLAGDVLWRASNALLFAMLGVLLLVFHRWRTRHREAVRAGETPIVATLVWTLASAILLAQIGSALALIGRPGGVFLFGLVFLVAFGSFLFARMLFLWQS
jgi:hypothetical protein